MTRIQLEWILLIICPYSYTLLTFCFVNCLKATFAVNNYLINKLSWTELKNPTLTLLQNNICVKSKSTHMGSLRVNRGNLADVQWIYQLGRKLMNSLKHFYGIEKHTNYQEFLTHGLWRLRKRSFLYFLCIKIKSFKTCLSEKAFQS